MKVVAYSCLHYGADFLAYAIRSVIDHVDEYIVLYSASGSHGSRTHEPCPDSRATLHAIASAAAGNKLRWIDGNWIHEGDQRNAVYQYAGDADVILVLDADEIWTDNDWHAGGLRGMLESTLKQERFAYFRVPIIHYWRSFQKCVLHDPAFPVRIIVPRNLESGNTHPAFPSAINDIERRIIINHMGYSQRPEIVRYKLLTHGHRAEFRRDVDWFRDVFMANRQHDCHPVGSEYWNPEDVNPFDYMPEFMKTHPYARLQVIE